MSYLFETEEHAALRDQVAQFARLHIAPSSAQWEEDGEFPADLYRLAAEAQITGIGYPAHLGGSGGDLGHLIVAAEAMLLAGRSVGVVVGLGSHAIALPPILAAGTEEQQRRFLPPVLQQGRIAALAITEPDAGSDVARLRTRARRDGDAWVIDGTKTFITSGCRADYVCCAVRTGEAGHGGLSMIIVERGTPGFTVSKKLKKTGWWASDTAELSFDGCRVPAGNLIGEEGSGFLTIMQNFVNERLMLAAQCVAISTIALQEAIAWAQVRRAFDRNLSQFQVTRHKLADMQTRLAAARALTGEAVTRQLRGDATPALAAMAKNHASDACSFICDQAVQIHGGYGYMRETLVERLYRDARLYPIGGGTREIMNEIIAKTEGW